MNDIDITKIDFDALKKAGSAAAENAGKSLSETLMKKIEIFMSDVVVVANDEIHNCLGINDDVVNVVYLDSTGELSGIILMIFSISESLNLTTILTGEEIDETGKNIEMDDMALSAIKELGNICAGWYLRAIGEMMKLTFSFSVPYFISDNLKTVINKLLTRKSLDSSYTLIFKIAFTVEGTERKSYIIFVPENKTLKSILA